MKEPEISVGIVNAQEIHFSLNGNFFAKGETVCGEQQVAFSEGGILWNGNLYRELTFTPQDEHASFSLYDVTIGINFHWERQETQSFMGTLKLVVDEGKITAINILPAEDYLISVISSEMNATSSLEFLKAHAVVSRSWLFAQIEKRKALSGKNEGFFSFIKNVPLPTLPIASLTNGTLLFSAFMVKKIIEFSLHKVCRHSMRLCCAVFRPNFYYIRMRIIGS